MSVQVEAEAVDIQSLLSSGLHTATVPAPYGAQISTEAYRDMLIGLTQLNPSVALSMSMHCLTVWGMNHIATSPGFDKAYYFGEVSANQALFASPNDPVLYFKQLSDVKADTFPVKVKYTEGGIIVNGLRPYVSLEPFVQFLPIMGVCYDEALRTNRLVFAMVHKYDNGVHVKKDWDTISMNQTHSNTVELREVFLPSSRIIWDQVDVPADMDVFPYLFRIGISSVYYGIAQAAFEYVLRELTPTKWAAVRRQPGLQSTLAEMKILLDTSAAQLARLCRLTETYLAGEAAPDLTPVSLMTKEYVLTSAEKIVELGVQVMGAGALDTDSLLSRLYLDVKANGFHLPRADVLKEIIAKQKLGVITMRSRWC